MPSLGVEQGLSQPRTGRSRRERTRAATIDEILTIGRRLLCGGGVEAVTLRAVARELEMTGSALYRYHASVDEMLAALREHVTAELCTQLCRAVDPSAGPAARAIGGGRELRRWSLLHPAEFELLFAGGTAASAPSDALSLAARTYRAVFATQPGRDLAVSAGEWVRICGLVAMEVFGHIRAACDDPESLFEAELTTLCSPARATPA